MQSPGRHSGNDRQPFLLPKQQVEQFKNKKRQTFVGSLTQCAIRNPAVLFLSTKSAAERNFSQASNKAINIRGASRSHKTKNISMRTFFVCAVQTPKQQHAEFFTSALFSQSREIEVATPSMMAEGEQ